MALQGTLDTFALADLVRLLATTGKTGQLTITGDRGRGGLWFVDGALVAGDPASDDVADAVFALLRFEEGDFAFAADVHHDDAGEPVSGLDALSTAEARLAAWLPVAELVPTPAVTLRLREDLPEDEVTLDRDRWRRLLLVAGGTTAGAFGAALDLDEVSTGFAVRDLVDAGLVEVGEPAAETQAAEVAVAVVDPEDAPVDAVAVVGPDPKAPVAEETEVEPEETGADVVALAPEPLASVLPDDDRYTLGDWEDPDEVARPLIAVAPDDLSAETDVDAEAPATPERLRLAAADSWAADEAVPSALGPWEPLTPAAEAPTAADQPATDETVDAPAVAPGTESAPPSSAADIPTETGSLDVDLDRQLGAAASGHSYLGTSVAPAGLPEPLLGGPEPLLVDGPEPLLGVAPAPPEPVPSIDVDDDDRPWAGADATTLPMESLSPAAARAVAAAAHGDHADDTDTDAGRRVLRRIISTGKG